MATLASSGVGALRSVCSAIDRTVARVFFTRWFSSWMRSSLSRSAAPSSSTVRKRLIAAPRRFA